MFKIASVALSAALGVAGVAQSTTAEAHPYVTVGVGVPGVAVVEPFGFAPAYYGPGYYRPYYHGYGPYGYGPHWRPGYLHYGHGYYHHWDRR